MIQITIPINPVPASRPRVTRYRVYYPEQYENFRVDFDSWLMKQKKIPIMEGLLFVSCKFYIKMPDSFSKKKQDKLDGTYCDKNYDIDNLEKAIYDKLSGFYIKDDRYIVKNENIKCWGKEPRIEVIIRQAE